MDQLKCIQPDNEFRTIPTSCYIMLPFGILDHLDSLSRNSHFAIPNVECKGNYSTRIKKLYMWIFVHPARCVIVCSVLNLLLSFSNANNFPLFFIIADKWLVLFPTPNYQIHAFL